MYVFIRKALIYSRQIRTTKDPFAATHAQGKKTYASEGDTEKPKKEKYRFWIFYLFFLIFCMPATAPTIPSAAHAATIDGDDVGAGVGVVGTVVGLRVVGRGVTVVCCVIMSVGATVTCAGA